MTFDEWWDRQDESLKFIMSKETAQYTWLSARLESMVEVRDWLNNKKKWYEALPAADGVVATLDELWVIIAANVERGGDWSTFTIND